jgi:adenylate cyclase 10
MASPTQQGRGVANPNTSTQSGSARNQDMSGQEGPLKNIRSVKEVSTTIVNPKSGYPSRLSVDHTGKVTELQNYVTNKIEVMKRNQAQIRKCTQLAAFIPDFILTEEITRKIPYQTSKEAVVVMADVSGFTSLTEAYSNKGKGGADQLTKTLMNYIGPLARCILDCDGDIVKYAGDAFLAFWPSNNEDFAEDVQRVIDCALYIQEKHGSYFCKDVGITIKVKIGIGAGQIHLSWIGNESYQHYVCFGPGVEAASAGEHHCTSGEVVLHPSVWQYCSPSNYKVVSRGEGFQVVSDIYTFINPNKRGRPTKASGRRASAGMDMADDTIRPKISEWAETKSEDFMRKFVIHPVLKKLDDEIQLEYLNELRIICLCFIHVETEQMSHEGIAFRETMTKTVNKGFLKIYSVVTKMQGALTKVIMFDKGLTYLVGFGLPGFINENQVDT